MATPYPPSLLRPVFSLADDAEPRGEGATEPVLCDACDQLIEGEPGGEGVYLWSRGGEIRYEKAPLCVQCATAIGVTALSSFEVEEEDG